MVLILALLTPVGVVHCQVDVFDQIAGAYDKLVEVSGNGGDVTKLVQLLNTVVSRVESGEYDPDVVSSEIESIMVQADALNARSMRAERDNLIMTTAIAVVVIVVEYYLWKYFPYQYWSLWLRRRGDWTV